MWSAPENRFLTFLPTVPGATIIVDYLITSKLLGILTKGASEYNGFMRHLLYEETAAAWDSFLAATTTSSWLDYPLQDIHGPFGYWSELGLPPSRSTRAKRAPLQSTPRCEPPPKERDGIFGEGCEIRESAPCFRRYSSFCHFFQERARSLSPSQPLTELSPPISLPPFPICTAPINWYHIFMLSNSLLYRCGFFRPVVAYFIAV